MLWNRFNLALIAGGVAALACGSAAAQERAGETVRVQPQSYQRTGAYPFNLRRGSEIYRQANVFTKEYGSVSMLFDDGTDLTLGPDTDVTIDEYVYSPGGGGQAAISFGKGVLRMVSGTMPKGSVTIDTPVATVGIRGTTFTLALPTTNQLRGWVEDGTVTAAPDQSSQVFAFSAPAAFVCSAAGCEQTDGGPPPGAFPASPPDAGFGFGPGDGDGEGEGEDAGHDSGSPGLE